jgi:chromate transporter
VAGALFILPGLVSIMALSFIYAAYGQVGVVAALFFGLKAAVLAIVLQAVVRIGGRALRNPTMQLIAAAAFVAIFAFDVPFPLIVLAAGIVGYLGGRAGRPEFETGGGHGASKGVVVADADSALGEAMPDHARPSALWSLRVAAIFLALWLVPVGLILLVLGPGHVFGDIALFFSKMAVVTFRRRLRRAGLCRPGGGRHLPLAQAGRDAGRARPGRNDARPAHHGDPVRRLPRRLPPARRAQPLRRRHARRAAHHLGDLRPVLLWIFLGAPYVEALRGNRALGGALSAITAAVVGVILNLALWFALHVLFARVDTVRWGPLKLAVPDLATLNPVSLVLSAAALVALFRFKVGVPWVLAGAAAGGLAVYLATGATG